jgi:hypothetical protein
VVHDCSLRECSPCCIAYKCLHTALVKMPEWMFNSKDNMETKVCNEVNICD